MDILKGLEEDILRQKERGGGKGSGEVQEKGERTVEEEEKRSKKRRRGKGEGGDSIHRASFSLSLSSYFIFFYRNNLINVVI